MGRPSTCPEEFRREAVELARSSGRTIADVARSLGISDATLGHRVAADREAGARVAGHRRLLRNGHCTRPSDLDRRFQTICGGCGFFETGPQFVQILSRQREDATAHVDRVRAKLYGDLVSAIDPSSTGPGQPGAGLVG